MSEQETGQYVAYTFYKVDPAWRRLPIEERGRKDAFADVVESWAERLELRAYSTAGVRPDCDFFLWKITERYEDLGELGAALNGTPLAGWLENALLVPRDDEGLAVHLGAPGAEDRPARPPLPRRLPLREGAALVRAHRRGAAARDGRAHPRSARASPRSRTTRPYSFGIDDQEFMTAFECEEPSDFMHLMLTLRDSEASRYTERDTPIFVGQAMEIRAALDALDGAGSRIEAT